MIGRFRSSAPHPAGHGGGQRGGIERRPQCQVHPPRSPLDVRLVVRDAGGRLEIAVFDSTDHADDGQPGTRRVRAAGLDAFSDGGVIGPELLRERLVDDRDRQAVGGVLQIKQTPGDERDSHGLEILPQHRALVGREFAGGVCACEALDGNRLVCFAGRKGQARDAAGGIDAREGCELLLKLGVQRQVGRRVGIVRALRSKLEREHVPGREAGVHMPQPPETVHQQAGARQQHEREDKLADNEIAPEGMATVPE